MARIRGKWVSVSSNGGIVVLCRLLARKYGQSHRVQGQLKQAAAWVTRPRNIYSPSEWSIVPRKWDVRQGTGPGYVAHDVNGSLATRRCRRYDQLLGNVISWLDGLSNDLFTKACIFPRKSMAWNPVDRVGTANWFSLYRVCEITT